MMWNDQFLLGIKEIDEQHKKLVGLVEQTKDLVYEAEDGVDCYDDLVIVLKELVDYTIYHFNFEENLMESVNYEGLIGHKMEHKIFVKKISQFMSDDLDENQLEKIEQITFFLLDWITKHILGTDSKYVHLLR
ncbi:MAG: bacteriohemerythrin [Firmicutes bacterium HGW-Firmicutes-1]|nr:MAG: bacteriohemerythrin [Firmicutes bacterium HGW-Firmicutes-1]